MKYIKYFENIDWIEDWEEEDPDYELKLSNVKKGDKFIVTDKLYKKYEKWASYFLSHINKKIFTVHNTGIYTTDHGSIPGISIEGDGYWVPLDTIKLIKDN